MNWMYNDVEYTDKHDDTLYGFIYCVYFESGDGKVFKYYGKKKWFSETKRHFGKKELAKVTDNRLKTYEYIIRDNDWRTYTGSCKDTRGYIPIYKEIICFTRTQREHTYLEVKVMSQRSALEDELCLNANILNRFYKGKLV
jgi:hypothetical protein